MVTQGNIHLINAFTIIIIQFKQFSGHKKIIFWSQELIEVFTLNTSLNRLLFYDLGLIGRQVVLQKEIETKHKLNIMYLVRQVAERKHASLSFPDLLHLLKYV